MNPITTFLAWFLYLLFLCICGYGLIHAWSALVVIGENAGQIISAGFDWLQARPAMFALTLSAILAGLVTFLSWLKHRQ